MKSEFDLEKEYGVVLEGGGAKGAYQIGVWKALIEYGVKIKGICGVSVGALNGALICMGDYEKAQSVWENITYSQVLNVDEANMDHLVKGNLSDVSFSELKKDTTKFLSQKGIDASPLKELIKEHIDEDKIRNSSIELIISIFSVSNKKEIDINVKKIEPGLICDYLMGSANFPAFKNERLHGKKYLDGGVANNVPMNHLINRGYKDIIVIRIFGIGVEKNVKIPDDVNVIEIAPKLDLGNILEFDNRKTRRNIKLGYFDGIRCIRNLEGKIYYIDGTHSENYYATVFGQVSLKSFQAFFDLNHIEITDSSLFIRRLFEEIYPLIAKELKLEKDWCYKDLFLSMIELCAKSIKIQKYQIYHEKDLCNFICELGGETLSNKIKQIPMVKAIFDIVKDLNILLVDKMYN